MPLIICKSSAPRLVITSLRGEGAEAWLKLVQRYGLRSQPRAANQLVQLLNAYLSGDLEDLTLLWERMIKTNEEQTEKVFAEDLRICIWLSDAAESAIKTPMLMRTELVRWADSRLEMMTCFFGPSLGFPPTPLNIGAFALGNGKKGKGKGKGRGKGVASSDKCGKSGHTAECL